MRRWSVKFVVKALGSTQELLRILADLRLVGVTGTDGGAVKCVDIVRNANGENSSLGVH